MTYVLYACWGTAIGFFSGILGIGGGIFIIPTLVYFFGLTQHQAQGTSLAMMVPPIGLLAAYRYWSDGNVLIPVAVIGAIGFFIGGYFGADVAHGLSDIALRRAFGTLLLVVGLKMLIS